MKAQPKINYLSKANKKKLQIRKPKYAMDQYTDQKGLHLLKKIGTSPEDYYRFLTIEIRGQSSVYLPPIEDCSIDYLSNVQLGIQPHIDVKQAEEAYVEKKDEISMDRCREDLSDKPHVLEQFPPRQETCKETGEKILRMPCRIWALTIYKAADPDAYQKFLETNRKENRDRQKCKENQTFKALAKFVRKAEVYEEKETRKGTMPASVVNRHMAVEKKRKRRAIEGKEDLDKESSDSVFLPDDLEDEINQDNHEEQNKLHTKYTDVLHKSDYQEQKLRSIEEIMQKSAWDKVKDIADDNARVTAQDTIAAEMEETQKDINLQMPTQVEALQSQDI